MSATDQTTKSTQDAVRNTAVASDPQDRSGEPSGMYVAFLQRVKRRRRLILLSQFILLVLFFAIWEVAPRANGSKPVERRGSRSS